MRGIEVRHPDELAAEGRHPCHLGIDVGDSTFDDRAGVTTRARSAVLNLEDLFDLRKLESHRLGSLDELEEVQARFVVLPIAGRRSGRFR